MCPSPPLGRILQYLGSKLKGKSTLATQLSVESSSALSLILNLAKIEDVKLFFLLFLLFYLFNKITHKKAWPSSSIFSSAQLYYPEHTSCTAPGCFLYDSQVNRSVTSQDKCTISPKVRGSGYSVYIGLEKIEVISAKMVA